MPIARKKPPKPTLPETLADDARLALYYAVVSTYHEEKYKEIKKVFFERIAACDDVTLIVGESLKFADGLVRWQARANPVTDTDQLVAAVHEGKLTVETLVALVSKWDSKAVASLLPDAVTETQACPECAELAEPVHHCVKCQGTGLASTATEFGVMQATPQYKAKVIAEIEAADARLAASIVESETDLAPLLVASIAQQKVA